MNKELDLLDDLLLLDELDSIDYEEQTETRGYTLTEADLSNGVQVQA